MSKMVSDGSLPADVIFHILVTLINCWALQQLNETTAMYLFDLMPCDRQENHLQIETKNIISTLSCI